MVNLFSRPDLAQFGWAVVIGLGAAVLVAAIRRIARALKPPAEHRILVAAPLTGLAVAALAIAYAEVTGNPVSDILFSGQDQLGGLVTTGAGYSVGALLLLLLCKSLAYAGSLAAFRGGPTFPAVFLGAAAGILLTHLPGLPLVPAIAMGMGAATVAMLGLPLTSVLVATLILGADGLATMPLVIVAVTVSFVASARLAPRSTAPDGADPAPEVPGATEPVPQPRRSAGDRVPPRGSSSS